MTSARFVRLQWAWEQVRPRLGQLSLVIAVVAIGVGLAGGVLLANRALQEGLSVSSESLSGDAQVVISPGGGEGALDPDWLDDVRATDGVAAAAPLVLGTAFRPDRTPLRIVGLDMLDEATLLIHHRADGRPLLEDALLFLSQSDSALVPRAALRRWRVDEGDRIPIQTPAGHRELTVRGVLDDEGAGLSFGGAVVVMDSMAAQETLGLGGVSRIDVLVEAGTASAEVVARLRRRLPRGMKVERSEEASADDLAAVSAFQLYFDAIALVGLLLGAVITANRLATVYEAREVEIGILRSQGMSPGEVLRRLLVEVAVVTALGVVLGMVVAVGLAQLIAGPLTQGIAAALRQEIAATWVPVRARPLMVAAVAGMASGLMAALRPAHRASRGAVAETLAQGRSRAPRPDGRVAWGLRWGTIGAACLGLAALSWGGARWDRLGPIVVVVVGAAGVALLRPALRLATALVRSFFGSTESIGLDDQGAVPGRAVGAAAVLLFGGALVVLVTSLGASFEDRIIAETSSPRQGDLVVDSSANVLSKGEGEPRLREEVIERIRAIPGVSAAVAGVACSIDDPVTGIWAVDGEWLRRPAFGDFLLVGDFAPDAIERVARGEALLAHFPPERAGAVGDVVTLLTPSGPLRLPIAARMESVSLHPAGSVVLSRALYREYWRDRSIHHVHLLLDADASPEDVSRRILTELGPTFGLRVQTPAELESWYRASIRQALIVADAIAIVALLVVLLGTADALAANVHERTREIGSMRALGCSPADVRRMVLAQALGIGLAGAAVAVMVGLGWSLAYVEGVLPAMIGWQLRLWVPMPTVIAAGVVGIAACVSGALVPARRASRLSVVEALRHD